MAGARKRMSFGDISDLLGDSSSLSDLSNSEGSNFSPSDDSDSIEETDSDDESDRNSNNNTQVQAQAAASNQVSWDQGPIKQNKFAFKAKTGLKVPPPTNPYEAFRMIFEDEALDEIVRLTNIYGGNKSANPTKPNARTKRWHPVSKDEILRFLGLAIHMGAVNFPEIPLYWSTNPLYKQDFFRKVMSRNRFQLILSCIHFSDEANYPESKSAKTDYMVNYLNSQMEKVYTPEKDLSIDESQILWRGRLSFRQYIKGKRHKYGIKFYFLCENNGLTLKAVCYTGAGTLTGEGGHAIQVVLHLMSSYFNDGYSLFMDNFYNSVALSKILLEKQTYVTGTLRKKRKNNSDDVQYCKLKKGESTWRHHDGIVMLKWKDNRDVLMLSTEFGVNNVDTVNRRNQVKQKPECITKYNAFMGGIDRSDQFLSYYPIERKARKWYRKVCFRIIHIMLTNARVLYNTYSGKPPMKLLAFREAVVLDLVKAGEPAVISPQPPAQHGYHFAKKSENGKRKACRVCSRRKLRKATSYYCPLCPTNPGLCLDCFPTYHM